MYIKYAIEKYYEEPENTEDAVMMLLNVLVKRMLEEGEVPTPMEDVNHVMDSVDIENMEINSVFSLNESLVLRIDKMKDQDGKLWIPIFTDTEELHKGDTANITLNLPIYNILNEAVRNVNVDGIVINPFGQFISIQKDLIKAVLDHYRMISNGKSE